VLDAGVTRTVQLEVQAPRRLVGGSISRPFMVHARGGSRGSLMAHGEMEHVAVLPFWSVPPLGCGLLLVCSAIFLFAQAC
jgi:hypothetical protein